MAEQKKVEEQPNMVEGIVLGHELLENGTRLVILVGEMEYVPRKLKLVW